MCWITKEEFFQHFPTIYLSAFNTARLKEDDYVNDLTDEFPRDEDVHPSTSASASARNAYEEAAERSDSTIELSSSDDESDDDDDVRRSSTITGRGSLPSASTRTTSSSSSDDDNDDDDEERNDSDDDDDIPSINSKRSQRQREEIRGNANQVELMKQKMEDERNKKNKKGRTGAKRPALQKGMSKVELMKLKFQGEKYELLG